MLVSLDQVVSGHGDLLLLVEEDEAWHSRFLVLELQLRITESFVPASSSVFSRELI